MVPLFSQRRHRLYDLEIPEAIEGLRLRLLQHLKTRGNLHGATVAFRAFYRLMEHRAGRPDYPDPVTWSLIESWVNGTIIKDEERPRRKGFEE